MNLHIIKNRKIWFLFSGTLTVISIVTLLMFGLKLGIDFTGGTLLEIKADKLTTATLNTSLKEFKEDLGSLQTQTSGADSVIMRFKYISNEAHIKLINFLKQKYPTIQEMRYENIGPVIGEDLKRKAIIALFLASMCIIMYIAFAFRKIPQSLSSWKFGVSAVLALIHDVFITIGFFSILGVTMGVEVDSLFVTALLTIIGFSVHDTIVVFDRIREHVIRDHRITFAESAERSINETIARSINTSLTTLITLTALFIFAGPSIRYFVLALIFGIAIGTYSSIFVASPILVAWRDASEKAREDRENEKLTLEKLARPDLYKAEISTGSNTAEITTSKTIKKFKKKKKR